MSLVNSFAKIITKVLAERLAPWLNDLVSMSQNAFIKKRCIYDNFLYVQNIIRALHKSKRPSLFVKLDISRGFDSITCPFLLEVMAALGFGKKWRNWMATLLATTSSKVLLNGIPRIFFDMQETFAKETLYPLCSSSWLSTRYTKS